MARLRRPNEGVPRLVLRFAAFTAVGLALATAAIVLVVRQESTAQAQRHAIDRTRFATEAVLGRELRPADLRARVSTSRRRELDGLFRDGVLLEGILAVSLYSADGRLTYSTVAGDARRALPASHLREALGGVAVSDVDASQDGQQLRTYVPLVLGDGRATGVAVFDQDYSPIHAASRRSTWLVAGVLEGLLLVLFIVLAPVLMRVTSRVRRQIGELEHAATNDDLTKTPNRVACRRAVEERLAAGTPSALLLLDLNGFSEIDQVLGADGGDAVLLEVALRLRWELADCELVARLGEDEFGVLIDSARPAEIAAVAGRARDALAPPVVVDGVRVGIAASMGAAILGEHGTDFPAVLRRAGAALAAAKREGSESVLLYEPGHDADDVSRIALAAELRGALDAGELLVHYQPQLDLMTRQVRGVEVLLRWQHPERGLLPAAAFIESAEHGGFAKKIRHLVLEASARQWQEWSRLEIGLELSVNLSPVDLLDSSLPDEVADLLSRYGMAPSNLTLEITERTLVGDKRRADQVLDRLREIGVRLAIDDFGTGYSSLASLSRFRIHIVKLDRSLVAGAPGDAALEAIVSGSVKMAHAIGALVVAEGIETREELALAQALGCDIAQGHAIGHPVPGDEIAERLQVTPLVTPQVAA